MSIARCAHCIGGTVLSGSCIACGREVGPTLVTLSEALTKLAEPERHERHDRIGPRQQVPLSVSLERARRWGEGLEA